MTTIKLGRRYFTAGAAAGAASFGLPALAQGEPIKVGVIFPLSGPAGPNGQGVAHAVSVAFPARALGMSTPAYTKQPQGLRAM